MYNYSKYKFKCLLTKDPSETSSLEYIIKTNGTIKEGYCIICFYYICIYIYLNLTIYFY